MSDKNKVVECKDRSPNSDLVAEIKKLLELAETGEIRSLFYVKSYSNQGVYHGWVLDSRCYQKLLLSEMSIAQYEFMTRLALLDKDSMLNAP